MAASKHPLEEQRGGVVLGLIGAWGVGVAFMLAHVFILVGLTLCSLSLLLATSLYWRHFRASFQALSGGSKVNEVGALEVILVFSTIILAFPLSGYLYWTEAYMVPEVEASARMQMDRVDFVPEGSRKYIRLQMLNKGNLASSGIVIVASAEFVNHPLEQKQTDEEMDKVLALKISRRILPVDPQTQPNSTFFINSYQATVTDDEISKLNSGNAQLYIFLAAYYYDQGLQKRQFYRTQFCGYLQQQADRWIYCAGSHNDIVRLPH